MVTINGLVCGATYTIIAGGTHNGNLIGPKSEFGNINEVCLSSGPSRNEDEGKHFDLYAKIYSRE